MFANIKTDQNNGVPIYKQIGDCIQRAVDEGLLPAGYKLPTVRELADEINISTGTVKHAYEYLEQLDVIEMIQGKGSFVLGNEEDSSSRKDKAMVAVDELFAKLEKLGFTPREMEIYINLKLKGLEEKYEAVKIAAIDCNPEALQIIERQISQIGYAETAVFGLSHLPEIAEKLNTDYDLVLTTSTHYGEVEPYIKNSKSLGMMALMPSTRTVIKLAKIPEIWNVGVVCASDSFAKVVRDNCLVIGDWAEHMGTMLFGNSQKLKLFLKNKDAIILPEGYDSFASREERETIRHFEQKGKAVILYDYKIDKGSFIYVEELIKKCINNKRSI
ncbi:MAG: GntR family transcriptional regulator [Firmicutes bacterium]|nr:GntR family transcriptional regulator [Bacillota bacterium]